MELYKPNKDFDFDLLSLESPQSIQGGTHFTKINMNTDKPLYLQMPKCTTKQGIVKTNRVMYSDLLYNRNNTESLVDWLLALEKVCQTKINEKKDLWFVNEIAEDDIENMMTPVYRLYRSGKNLLIRTFIDVDRGTEEGKCMIYDEKEIKLHHTAMLDANIIPLILIEGIKFTSKSFDIEIKLIQAMVLNKEPELMQTCLIKRDSVSHTNDVVDKREEITNDSIHTNIGEEKLNDVTRDPKVAQEPEEAVDSHNTQASSGEAELQTVQVSDGPDTNSVLSEDDTNEDDTTEDYNNKSILDYDYVPEEKDYLENISNDLEEVDIEPDDSGSVSLKQPNEIYAEIYRAARTKAKLMRKATIQAFLEADKIKTRHLLDDIDSSDDEDYSSDEELNSF